MSNGPQAHMSQECLATYNYVSKVSGFMEDIFEGLDAIDPAEREHMLRSSDDVIVAAYSAYQNPDQFTYSSEDEDDLEAYFARQGGASRKKTVAKKTVKKPVAKKTPVKKTAAKKPVAKKTPVKKTVAKKKV